MRGTVLPCLLVVAVVTVRLAGSLVIGQSKLDGGELGRTEQTRDDQDRADSARRGQGYGLASPWPAFKWDTVPLFWHAADANGPFNASTLNFIARFPLATIEKFQGQDVAPIGTGAEEKIVAAAKQIKERSADVKVLFYLNSIMDWDMYDLHTYCKEHSHDMWLYNENHQPVLIRNQTVFNVSSERVRQTWIAALLNASKSGYIDGAFVDRGAAPQSLPGVSAERMAIWKHGHDLHMSEIQAAMGPDKIVISNNQDYIDVNARMFERFFVNDFDKNSAYLDLVALMHEATYPHLAEVHGEPCTPVVFNASLTAYLVGAGQYAYYACTAGWSVQTGWMDWHAEYSKPLGEPLGAATTINDSAGFCGKSYHSHVAGTIKDIDRNGGFDRESPFWAALSKTAVGLGFNKPMLSRWIDDYWMRNPNEAKPIFGRRFASGTCVTLDFRNETPIPCIVWSDRSWTGSDACL